MATPATTVSARALKSKPARPGLSAGRTAAAALLSALPEPVVSRGAQRPLSCQSPRFSTIGVDTIYFLEFFDFLRFSEESKSTWDDLEFPRFSSVLWIYHPNYRQFTGNFITIIEINDLVDLMDLQGLSSLVASINI